LLFSSKQWESSSLGRATWRSVILAQVGVDNALPELKRKMAGAASLANKWIFKKAGKSRARVGALFHALQLLPDSSDVARNFSNGSWHHRSRVEFG
jgi:hypothetical protein